MASDPQQGSNTTLRPLRSSHAPSGPRSTGVSSSTVPSRTLPPGELLEPNETADENRSGQVGGQVTSWSQTLFNHSLIS